MKQQELPADIVSKLGNIIFVTPEMKSFKSKVGGLGDVAEELGKELADMGIKITFITPLYKRMRYKEKDTAFVNVDYTGIPIEDTGVEIDVEVNGEKTRIKIKKSKIGKADVIFLENETYADVVYSGDLLRHAIFMGRATLDVLKALDIKPTIIHLHDALTSLVSFVRTDNRYSKDPFFENVKLCYTVHNAGKAYQEIFVGSRFAELGIDTIHWYGMSFYDNIDLMFAGLFHSQICNAVSVDYAEFLKSGGEGFAEVFRRKSIFGIVNGIETDYWKLKRPKKEAKLDLIRQVKERTGVVLDENRFTITLPRRIAYQKGLDVLFDMMDEIVKYREDGGVGAQFVLLGRAHELDELGKRWEVQFEKMAQQFKNKFVFINDFDQAFAKLMYEGGDLLFYPSRPNKEPCGTGYILAMANMTPSVATDTGGIVELIQEFNPKTGKGNGFKVGKEKYSAQAFLNKIKIASDIFHEQPELWKKLLANAFSTDDDMRKCAEDYIKKVYLPLILG